MLLDLLGQGRGRLVAQDLDENPAFEGEPTPPTGAERRTDEHGLARSYLAPVGPYLGELGGEPLQLNPS